MSVLIYIIQSKSNIGFESFFFQSQDDGALIQRYTESLTPYLDPLKEFENVVLVFEAGGNRIRKKRSTILNNGIRNVFLKRFNGSTAIGKKAISRAVGVPPLEIQYLLGASLHDKYRFDCVCSNSTADQLIFQMVNAARAPSYVYSVDHDFLVYSKHVTGLIGPKLSNRFVVNRSDVLAGFNLNSDQLVWAYVASGSDGLGAGFQKIGFKTAISGLEESPTIQIAYKKFKNITNQEKEKLISALTKFLDQLETEPLFLKSFPLSKISLAHQFIFSKKANGSRVRLLKLVLDANSPYGIGIAEDVDT
jgi:hypothetical protein